MLHIFLAPSEESVKDVLAVHLYRRHHSVGHSFGADVIVLYVGNIGKAVLNLKVDLVRSEEDLIEHLIYLGLNCLWSVAGLDEDISLFLPWSAPPV